MVTQYETLPGLLHAYFACGWHHKYEVIHSLFKAPLAFTRGRGARLRRFRNHPLPGGVWKTCISASLAERLAFAGLDVLYLVTDDPLDARRRLGISESDPDVARVQRGPGSITVVGLAGVHAVDVLYRSGRAASGASTRPSWTPRR